MHLSKIMHTYGKSSLKFVDYLLWTFVASADIVKRIGQVEGGVGGYRVLQKSVELETGVEGKEYYCLRIPTITKG